MEVILQAGKITLDSDTLSIIEDAAMGGKDADISRQDTKETGIVCVMDVLAIEPAIFTVNSSRNGLHGLYGR